MEIAARESESQPRAVATGSTSRIGILRSLSLAFAIAAQLSLTAGMPPLFAVLLFGIAVLLFLQGATSSAGTAEEAVVVPVERAAEPVSTGVSAQVAGLGVAALAVLAWITFHGNQFTLLNVTLWLGSVALFLAVFFEWPRVSVIEHLPRPPERPYLALRPTWTAVALVLIMCLGLFFRFYHLEQTPLEMTSDHAEKLLDVRDVLSGIHPVFFIRNTGREAFQFYLAAATVTIFGVPVNHIALKLGTAFFGLFAVPFAYLLAKELFNREIGLITATLVAMSQWATAIDRVGLRFPFTSAFTTPALFFLFRAFKHNRRNDWLLSGLFLGVGLHTYTPIRVVPLLLVALVLLKFGLDWLNSRRPGVLDQPGGELAPFREATALSSAYWRNAGLGLVVMLLVFIPLARYWEENPDVFWYRALTRSGDVERQVAGTAALTFIDNVKNALLMFNYRGDQVQINTVVGSPVLDPVSGALFVLGTAYILWRLIRFRDRRSLYLLTALFFLLLPSTLSIAFPNENPSVVRTGGAVPIVMTITALALWALARHIGMAVRASSPGLPRLGNVAAVAFSVVVLLFAVRSNYDWYFVRYDAQWRNAGWNATEMGRVVRGFATSIGDMQHAWHVPYPFWVDTRAIGFNAGSPGWENAIMLDQPAGVQRLREQAADSAPKLYIVKDEDRRSLDLLRETYPDGALRLYESAIPGRNFWVFLAPGAGRPA